MRSKELWLVQGNHATVKPDSSVTPRGMKTYSESRIELRNLQKSNQCLTSQQPFEPKSLHVARCILQKLKKIHCHLIGVLNERSALVTGEIVVFCGWWLSNQFDIVSETHFGCSAVGRELWLAILCSLLCPEKDWNIRIGKQGYVFILTDFKKWYFLFHSRLSISVSTLILRLGKVFFLIN